MSGKPKTKCYQYNRKGKLLQIFQSQTEVRQKYYPNDEGTRPLFRAHGESNNKILNGDYRILPDNTIISPNRIGRRGVTEINFKYNSPFVNISEEKKEVEIVNWDGEVIATFRSANIMKHLLNLDGNKIYAMIGNGVAIRHGLPIIVGYKMT